MKLFLILSTFNALATFIIFHKWNRKWKEKICLFCILGWLAIGECLLTFILTFPNFNFDFLFYVPIIWGLSIIFYTFTKMSFE